MAKTSAIMDEIEFTEDYRTARIQRP